MKRPNTRINDLEQKCFRHNIEYQTGRTWMYDDYHFKIQFLDNPCMPPEFLL